jgi:plasmid stabilization system protein ParE
MKGYEFLLEAEEEMNEAARFYERRKEGLGLEFLNEVEQTIASILAHPRSGPTISPNIRRRIARRFPFGVLYAIDGKKIVIVAVAHLKRRPGYWKERVGKDV